MSKSVQAMAQYHAAMLYREAVDEAIKLLSKEHADGARCPCHLFGAQAKELLQMAQEIGDVSMEIASKV